MSVLQFFGISLIPFAVALVIHLIFKVTNPLSVRKPEYFVPLKRKWLYKYVKYPIQKFGYIIFSTKKGAYWWRMSILGAIFAVLAIIGYYFGVTVVVNDEIADMIGTKYPLIGNSTVSPVIAGLIFGWPAGVISGVISFIFRMCVGNFFMRWPTAIALLVSGLVTATVSHFVFNDKRPKWYFGLLVAIFVETFNIFLIFLFNHSNVTLTYEFVSQFDVACILFAAFSSTLTNICITLIEKERILPKKKELKNISFSVQLVLFLSCIVGMGLMSYCVWAGCALKNEQDYTEIAKESIKDVKLEIDTLTSGMVIPDPEVESPQTELIDFLKMVTYNHHVTKQGYVVTVAGFKLHYALDGSDLIVYEKNSIIGAPDGHEDLINKPFNPSINGKYYKLSDEKLAKGKTVFCTFNKQVYLMVYDASIFPDHPIESDRPFAYTVVLIPYSEVESASGTVFRISLYVNALAIIAIFMIAEYFVNQKIVKKVELMDKALEDIMDGNLDREIHVEGYNEFSNLSNNINLTVGALKNYAHEVEFRIDNELQFARDIQTSSVPTAFPFEKTYNIYAKMEPAREVGGDFYDYFKMNNGRIMFLIADVSGKGIPAAMFMMRARTLIKSLSSTDMPLDEIVNTANKDLCTQNEASLFVTAWIGILNPSNGELRYINAGHMDPLVKKKNGKFQEFKNNHNFVLAANPDYVYKTDIMYLEPGDEIVLYTDGVTEAHNPQKELYGVNRLINFVNDAKYFTAKQLLDEISDDVVKYAEGTEQFDDTTLLIMRYLGNNDIVPETAITLKARPTNATLAVNFVESVLAKYELPPTFIARVSIVVDELFANVAFYAYPPDYIGEATIQVDFRNEAFYLTLIDSGKPFDPTAPREVDTTSNIEDRKRGGLGIFIVKKTMDELKYEYKDNKNVLNLVKYLKNIPQANTEEKKEINTDPDALEKALASLPDDEPKKD